MIKVSFRNSVFAIGLAIMALETGFPADCHAAKAKNNRVPMYFFKAKGNSFADAIPGGRYTVRYQGDPDLFVYIDASQSKELSSFRVYIGQKLGQLRRLKTLSITHDEDGYIRIVSPHAGGIISIPSRKDQKAGSLAFYHASPISMKPRWLENVRLPRCADNLVSR